MSYFTDDSFFMPMTNQPQEPSGKLAAIFAKINLSELPAMSSNVQELISLAHSNRSAAYDLAKVILKDYSLTNKVLQVVNSAYYSIGHSISSISKAVTILGFDGVRDLATAIALFEDFLKSGVEKEEISKILTRSFLSGLQAREMVVAKNINVLPEEAFICALLHHLGKIITCIYMPDIYKDIQRQVGEGISEENAARSLLDDLTYSELGREVAKFWNMSEKIIGSMAVALEKPKSKFDAEGYLQNLSSFTNEFTDKVCLGGDLDVIFKKFGTMFTVDLAEAIERLDQSVDTSEDVSDSIRYGLSKLNIRNNIKQVSEYGGKAIGRKRYMPADDGGGKGAAKTDECVTELAPLPSSDKSVNDFIREMTETLMGTEIKLDEFYVNLLESLYRGIGFDRVIMGILSIQASKISVIGRYGLGDIDANGVLNFDHSMANKEQAIPRALTTCKDMAIPVNAKGAFPKNFQYLVKDRTVFLFPICIDKKPIALIYLDRKQGRPKIDQEQLKTIRLFRDFAVMAIQKVRSKK
jgi:HD-like signal output (HDOD) protein